MPLSIPEIQIGAFVEDIFDERGGQKKLRRRGYITKVDYRGGEYGGDIQGIWIQFDKDKPSEKIENRRLALIRGYDAVAAGRIKQEQQNLQADKLVEDQRAVAMDKTGVETKERISEYNAKKFGLKVGPSA